MTYQELRKAFNDLADERGLDNGPAFYELYVDEETFLNVIREYKSRDTLWLTHDYDKLLAEGKIWFKAVLLISTSRYLYIND